MRTQISYILVFADDLDDAVGEAEAVLDPGIWDFFTMFKALDGSKGKDGLKPICAAEIGSDSFIVKIKELQEQIALCINDFAKDAGHLTLGELIDKKPDELWNAAQALRLASGDFTADAPFLNAIDMTTEVPEERIREIKQDPDQFWLVPVELTLV